MCGLQEWRAVTALTDQGSVPVGGEERSSGPRRLLVALAVMAAVVLVDQWTKWWALRRLSSGPIHIIGTLDLELSRNTGVSFSLFQGKAFVLIPVGVVLVIGLMVLAFRAPTTGRAAVLGLILGGALGNLSDRVFRNEHGAVVDFIALHFWPTFNVADASIVIGCALLLVSLIRGPRLT